MSVLAIDYRKDFKRREAMNEADTADGNAVLLLMLRQLTEAQGGMTQLAENSG
jgi:DNA-binding phage protein